MQGGVRVTCHSAGLARLVSCLLREISLQAVSKVRNMCSSTPRGRDGWQRGFKFENMTRKMIVEAVRRHTQQQPIRKQDAFCILISFPIQIFILKESHTSPYPQRPGTYSSRVNSYCTRRSRGKWKQGICHGSNQPIRNLPSGQVTSNFHIYKKYPQDIID